MKKETPHDKEVRRLAEMHRANGWNVKADVSGYQRPKTIGQVQPRIPDIVATKRGATRVIEVEDSRGMRRDKAQHATFRRHAAQKSRTTFLLQCFDCR